MTAALPLLLALLAADNSARDVRFLVEKEGLQYVGPCAADLYAVGSGQDPTSLVTRVDDAAAGVPLDDGVYHAVLACPSTEGTFKRTVGVKVQGRDTTVGVKMVPAFLVANVMRNGVEVPASVEIIDELGRVLVEGRDRVAYPVPEGKLTVRVVVDKKAAGRRKAVRGEVVVRTRAGKKEVPVIDTSDGKLLIELRANGVQVEGVGALRHKGSLDRLVEINAGEETEVPPGVFDLVTALYESHDYHEVVTRDVSIEPGKVKRVRVSHAVGELVPDVRLDGQTLPEDMKVDVELYLGAALKPFNTISTTETAKLRPDRFRVKAKVKKRKLDDGSPWEIDGEATVRAGKKQVMRLELAPARLEVVSTLGKAPEKARVEVLLEGGTAPVAKRAPAAAGEAVSFALKDGPYRIRSVLPTPHGEDVVERVVKLRRGRTEKLSLDHDLGRAVVQVFDKGVAVQAEVSFIADGAAAAALRIKAGKEAFLPPGAYTLVVHRKGKDQSFSPIKIVSGRLAERQLELVAAEGEAPKKAAADDDEEPPEPDDDGEELELP